MKKPTLVDMPSHKSSPSVSKISERAGLDVAWLLNSVYLLIFAQVPTPEALVCVTNCKRRWQKETGRKKEMEGRRGVLLHKEITAQSPKQLS